MLGGIGVIILFPLSQNEKMKALVTTPATAQWWQEVRGLVKKNTGNLVDPFIQIYQKRGGSLAVITACHANGWVIENTFHLTYSLEDAASTHR